VVNGSCSCDGCSVAFGGAFNVRQVKGDGP
jgi:hypothetical protein